ncbi:MAG: hypothetical protein JOZ29_18705 [Deltaproteobacteria bacterium]|nr:hypothetical protein [Deltaproteobacteria bacterium]
MSIGRTFRGDSCAVASAHVAVRTMLLLSIILIVAFYFDGGIAQAHGGGPGLGYDPCMQQSGADEFIHLAVYQPEFNPFAEYCGALPQAGRTLLVFDLIGAELSDAQVSLDVLQEGGRLQMSVPPQRYRSGVANLPADLPAGTYTVLVSIEQPDGHHRLRFPLVVGAWRDQLIAPIVIVLLIGLATAGYCLFQIRDGASGRGSSPMKNPVELRQRRQN